MKNEDTHTDKQLQGLFQSFEPTVPPGAWEGIAFAMDRKRKRRIVLWWIAAAALVGITGFWLNNIKQPSQVQKQEEIAKEQKAGNEESKTISTGEKPTVSAENKTPINGVSGGKTISVINPNSREKIAQQFKEQHLIKTEFALPEIIVNNYEFINSFGLRILPLPLPVADAITSFDMPKPKPYKAPESKWTLVAGVLQMQTGNGYSINPLNSRYVHKNYLRHMEDGEQNMGGTGFSLQLGYQLNSKITLTGGLQFRQLNTRQQFSFSDEVPVTLMPGNTPDKFGNYPIIGYFGSTGSVSYIGYQRNTMVEIPLGVNTNFALSSKWSLRPAIALNTGFITGISGFTLDYQQLQITPQQSGWFRKVQMSGSMSVGAYRKISRKLQWGASLVGTRMFTPAYVPNASIRPRNHAVGIGTQIIWRID